MFDLYHAQHLSGNITNNLKEFIPYIGHVQVIAIKHLQTHILTYEYKKEIFYRSLKSQVEMSQIQKVNLIINIFLKHWKNQVIKIGLAVNINQKRIQLMD